MIGIYLFSAFLVSGLLFFNRNTRVNYLLVVLFVLIQAAYALYAHSSMNRTDLLFFTPDAMGVLFFWVATLVGAAALFHGYIYVKNRTETPRTRAIFFSAMTLLITAVSAAYLANHIAVVWIFVEITTLSASALIYHHRNERSLEGTWKYVFICAISVTFIFIGILFLSMAMHGTGTTDMTFSRLLEVAPKLNTFWVRLAFLFIFTGFTAKLGLVPMYTAGIDAKDKAPAPAGALFSSIVMNMGFVGLFRVYVVVSHTEVHHWANTVVLIAALLSVFVAAVYMVKVKNLKRMFAYSSIEHMGLVMLGIAVGGVGYYAAVLHIILHSFVKSSLFFQFNQVYRIYQSKSMYDVGNYFTYNLTGAMVLLLGFVFATAMPPSGLFVSEFMIFRALFQGHLIPVLVVVMVLLTLIIWAFGKNMFTLLFTPPIDFDGSKAPKIPASHSYTQFVLLGLSVWLGLYPPDLFVEYIREAIKFLPL